MPMISDLDIYRSTNVLIREHGEEAPIEAAMRADTMLERGDFDGCAVWRRIVKATETLLADRKPPGELTH